MSHGYDKLMMLIFKGFFHKYLIVGGSLDLWYINFWVKGFTSL